MITLLVLFPQANWRTGVKIRWRLNPGHSSAELVACEDFQETRDSEKHLQEERRRLPCGGFNNPGLEYADGFLMRPKNHPAEMKRALFISERFKGHSRKSMFLQIHNNTDVCAAAEQSSWKRSEKC